MNTIVMDLDGTLTIDDPTLPYAERLPNTPVVDRVRQYKDAGFQIAIQTARNMRSHNGSIGVINARTLPVVLAWLEAHRVPYDEVYVGKPWPGPDGFYVDDRAIRPSEFLKLTHAEILALAQPPSV